MAKGKYTRLIEESDRTPIQGTAATVEPAANRVNHFPVKEALDYGQENAIGSKDLADLLRFDSIRELQKEIARERKAGAVILSTCEYGGGYFLPADSKEVKRFIRTLENRAKNTFAALQSARTFLGEQEETHS